MTAPAAAAPPSSEGTVLQCTFCETRFEPDVADPGSDGQPRCPQCGLSGARPIPPGERGEFVVTRRTKFR